MTKRLWRSSMLKMKKTENYKLKSYIKEKPQFEGLFFWLIKATTETMPGQIRQPG